MATSRPQLDADLGWALGVVFRAYVKAADAVVNDLPGGPRGYLVLTAAVAEANANQGSLAQHLGIDRTVMTYLIDDLEQAGLVERRPDPNDRRGRIIVATDRGRDVAARRCEALRHVERQVLATLGEDEPTFRTLLRRVAAQANDLDPAAHACEIVESLQDRQEKKTVRGSRSRRADPARR